MKKKYKYRDLNPLWISVFVDILGFSIILPFLPYFISEFETSPVIIGFLLSSNAIFGFFFGPILSKLSDNYGRKPMMLISLAGTLVGFTILIVSVIKFMLDKHSFLLYNDLNRMLSSCFEIPLTME